MTMMIDPALEGWKPRALPGFAGLVGPLWTRKEGDTWAYGVLADDRHTNPAGLVHGGMICTLLDHALSAIAWEANARKPCVTVAFDAHFLAPARAGDFMIARGRITRQTTTLAFLQGTLAAGEATIATASTVVRVL
jgi:uncharacterized protein (TIGR00369 family)